MLCSNEDQIHASDIVWENALHPFLEFDRSPKSYKSSPSPFSSNEKPDVNVRWSIPLSFGKETVDNLASRCKHSSFFEAVIENSLIQAMNLLSEYYSDSHHEHWNEYIHKYVPKIEDCENIRSDLQLIINTLRIFGEQHNKKDELADRWIQNDQIVLRRLAIHEKEISESNPDEKIEWILKQNLLFDESCNHEIRQFFKTVTEHISTAKKALLLKELQPQCTSEDIPNRAKATGEERQRFIHLYDSYYRICWLSESDSKWHEAQQLQSFYEKEFNFVPDPNSDIPLKIESPVKRTEPFSLEEFDLLVKKSPSKAISKILLLPKAIDAFDSFSFEDGCRLIGQYCSEHPQAICNLWDAIQDAPNITKYEKTQIVLFITNKIWSTEFKDVCSITQRVCAFDWNEADLYSPIFFITDQLNRVRAENADSFFYITQQFIDSLIPKFGQAFLAKRPDFNRYYGTYTLWPALIAKYQIEKVLYRYKNTPKTDWNGMSADEKYKLRNLLDQPDNLVWPIQIVCAQKIFILFTIDESFTRKHVLSLFLNANSRHQMWMAFLTLSSYTSSLPEEDRSPLLESLVEEAKNLIDYKSPRLRDNYWQVLFDLVNMLPQASKIHDAALKTVICNSNFSTLTEIAEFLFNWCSHQDTKQLDVAWENWLKTYMSERFHGIPCESEPEEQKALILLVSTLRSHISETLEILSNANSYVLDFSQNHISIPSGYSNEEQQQLIQFYQWEITHQTIDCDLSKLRLQMRWILKELKDEYPSLDLTALREIMKDQFGFEELSESN